MRAREAADMSDTVAHARHGQLPRVNVRAREAADMSDTVAHDRHGQLARRGHGSSSGSRMGAEDHEKIGDTEDHEKIGDKEDHEKIGVHRGDGRGQGS